MVRTAARLALATLALGLGAGPAPAGAETFHDGRPVMGTVLEITLEADDSAQARAALDACFARAAELEAIFTSWNPTSELMRLNARAGGAVADVSPELGRVLRDAVRLAEATEGAFDPTVGPLVALWREARLSGRMPPAERVEAARAVVGYAGIEVGRRGVRLARPGMSVDLGGFAKGWTLDRLGELLEEHGIRRALLDFGQSSLYGIGQPSDGPAWRVLVRDPRGGYAGVVSLRDQSLSVSEAFGESAVVEGRRLGHVIDPRSGRALDRRTGALVVAPSGAAAEAWSKALLVLEPEHALGLLENEDETEAMLLEPGGFRATPGFVEAVDFVLGTGAGARQALPPGAHPQARAATGRIGGMARDIGCPVCDADLLFSGDEAKGDTVICMYCGAPFKVLKTADDEGDWDLEDDF